MLADKGEMCISVEEKENISQSLTLLTLFLQATEKISGQKYKLLSMIIPLTRLLLKASSAGPDIPLRHLLVQELNKRFFRVEHRFTMAIATLVDPWFKKLAFAFAGQFCCWQRSTMVERWCANSDYQQSNIRWPASRSWRRATVNSLWATFDEKVTRATSHRNETVLMFF